MKKKNEFKITSIDLGVGNGFIVPRKQKKK